MPASPLNVRTVLTSRGTGLAISRNCAADSAIDVWFNPSEPNQAILPKRLACPCVSLKRQAWTPLKWVQEGPVLHRKVKEQENVRA